MLWKWFPFSTSRWESLISVVLSVVSFVPLECRCRQFVTSSSRRSFSFVIGHDILNAAFPSHRIFVASRPDCWKSILRTNTISNIWIICTTIQFICSLIGWNWREKINYTRDTWMPEYPVFLCITVNSVKNWCHLIWRSVTGERKMRILFWFIIAGPRQCHRVSPDYVWNFDNYM